MTCINLKRRFGQALEEAAQAESLRDSDATAAATAFCRDTSDTFSKLARYETTLERSLYKALHELQLLQTARAGRAARAPVTVDVNVDAVT